MKTRIMSLILVLVLLAGMATFGVAEEEKTVYQVTYLSCWSGGSASFPDDQTGNICAEYIGCAPTKALPSTPTASKA